MLYLYVSLCIVLFVYGGYGGFCLVYKLRITLCNLGGYEGCFDAFKRVVHEGVLECIKMKH